MSKTAKILVTEHKSTDPKFYANNMVRIFVNNDYSYGYFVPEEEVVDSLNKKDNYLEKNEFEIPIEKAQNLIDIGGTILKKPTLT